MRWNIPEKRADSIFRVSDFVSGGYWNYGKNVLRNFLQFHIPSSLLGPVFHPLLSRNLNHFGPGTGYVPEICKEVRKILAKLVLRVTKMMMQNVYVPVGMFHAVWISVPMEIMHIIGPIPALVMCRLYWLAFYACHVVAFVGDCASQIIQRTACRKNKLNRRHKINHTRKLS
jgi:hypothetical protein